MSDIVSDVQELQQIDKELANLRKRIRVLQSRKKLLENQIIQFMDENDQPGLKYKGVALVAEDIKRRKHKSKKTRIQDGMSVLRKYGLHNERALQELMEAIRGDVEVSKKLKVKKIM